MTHRGTVRATAAILADNFILLPIGVLVALAWASEVTRLGHHT